MLTQIKAINFQTPKPLSSHERKRSRSTQLNQISKEIFDLSMRLSDEEPPRSIRAACRLILERASALAHSDVSLARTSLETLLRFLKDEHDRHMRPIEYHALVELGNLQLAASPRDALESFLRALKIDPEDPFLWYRLGELAVDERHWWLAKRAFTHAAERLASAKIRLCEVLYLLDDIPSFYELFSALHAQYPQKLPLLSALLRDLVAARHPLPASVSIPSLALAQSGQMQRQHQLAFRRLQLLKRAAHLSPSAELTVERTHQHIVPVIFGHYTWLSLATAVFELADHFFFVLKSHSPLSSSRNDPKRPATLSSSSLPPQLSEPFLYFHLPPPSTVFDLNTSLSSSPDAQSKPTTRSAASSRASRRYSSFQPVLDSAANLQILIQYFFKLSLLPSEDDAASQPQQQNQSGEPLTDHPSDAPSVSEKECIVQYLSQFQVSKKSSDLSLIILIRSLFRDVFLSRRDICRLTDPNLKAFILEKYERYRSLCLSELPAVAHLCLANLHLDAHSRKVPGDNHLSNAMRSIRSAIFLLPSRLVSQPEHSTSTPFSTISLSMHDDCQPDLYSPFLESNQQYILVDWIQGWYYNLVGEISISHIFWHRCQNMWLSGSASLPEPLHVWYTSPAHPLSSERLQGLISTSSSSLRESEAEELFREKNYSQVITLLTDDPTSTAAPLSFPEKYTLFQSHCEIPSSLGDIVASVVSLLGESLAMDSPEPLFSLKEHHGFLLSVFLQLQSHLPLSSTALAEIPSELFQKLGMLVLNMIESFSPFTRLEPSQKQLFEILIYFAYLIGAHQLRSPSVHFINPDKEKMALSLLFDKCFVSLCSMIKSSWSIPDFAAAPDVASDGPTVEEVPTGHFPRGFLGHLLFSMPAYYLQDAELRRIAKWIFDDKFGINMEISQHFRSVHRASASDSDGHWSTDLEDDTLSDDDEGNLGASDVRAWSFKDEGRVWSSQLDQSWSNHFEVVDYLFRAFFIPLYDAQVSNTADFFIPMIATATKCSEFPDWKVFLQVVFASYQLQFSHFDKGQSFADCCKQAQQAISDEEAIRRAYGPLSQDTASSLLSYYAFEQNNDMRFLRERRYRDNDESYLEKQQSLLTRSLRDNALDVRVWLHMLEIFLRKARLSTVHYTPLDSLSSKQSQAILQLVGSISDCLKIIRDLLNILSTHLSISAHLPPHSDFSSPNLPESSFHFPISTFCPHPIFSNEAMTELMTCHRNQLPICAEVFYSFIPFFEKQSWCSTPSILNDLVIPQCHIFLHQASPDDPSELRFVATFFYSKALRRAQRFSESIEYCYKALEIAAQWNPVNSNVLCDVFYLLHRMRLITSHSDDSYSTEATLSFLHRYLTKNSSKNRKQKTSKLAVLNKLVLESDNLFTGVPLIESSSSTSTSTSTFSNLPLQDVILAMQKCFLAFSSYHIAHKAIYRWAHLVHYTLKQPMLAHKIMKLFWGESPLSISWTNAKVYCINREGSSKLYPLKHAQLWSDILFTLNHSDLLIHFSLQLLARSSNFHTPTGIYFEFLKTFQERLYNTGFIPDQFKIPILTDPTATVNLLQTLSSFKNTTLSNVSSIIK